MSKRKKLVGKEVSTVLMRFFEKVIYFFGPAGMSAGAISLKSKWDDRQSPPKYFENCIFKNELELLKIHGKSN